MKICVFSLGWIKSEKLSVTAGDFPPICFYIIRVCLFRLCQITFYIWWPPTFKTSKTENGCKNVNEKSVFYDLSDMNAQSVISVCLDLRNTFTDARIVQKNKMNRALGHFCAGIVRSECE